MATTETEMKNMTLRLDKTIADRVQVMAEVEGQTVTDVVREAIVRHVEQRRQDPQFRELLEASMRKHATLLELLADN